jgi:hypothetical protein
VQRPRSIGKQNGKTMPNMGIEVHNAECRMATGFITSETRETNEKPMGTDLRACLKIASGAPRNFQTGSYHKATNEHF